MRYPGTAGHKSRAEQNAVWPGRNVQLRGSSEASRGPFVNQSDRKRCPRGKPLQGMGSINWRRPVRAEDSMSKRGLSLYRQPD